MSTSRVTAVHNDWLTLVAPVGPWLTLPVLRRVWPAGADRTPNELRADVRSRLAELELTDQSQRTTWIEWLLGDVLGWGARLAGTPNRAVPETLVHVVPEHGVVLRPDYALLDPGHADAPGSERARVLVSLYPLGSRLNERVPGDRWSATPVERLALLCRATGTAIGLATDGDAVACVWAPPDSASGSGTFPTSLFGEEPGLLDAFRSVLGASRFFAAGPGDDLEGLFTESSSAQAEVTGKLGDQVRAAAELLVRAISSADRARSGTLLADVPPARVYEAAVTFLMRLVFLLSAEERLLLPLGDELYDSAYAASTLLESLRTWADRDGPEPLERSTSAWHRLLALTRAVHAGISHDRLRIPAYGGALFDPDRFPFLEGRSTDDLGNAALPVDDLTVLAMLGALQELQFRTGGITETRRLTYRSLDVEQIGHVYERLLDHTAVRAGETAVGLVGKAGNEPEVALAALEAAAARGDEHLAAWLTETTGLTARRVGALLGSPPDLVVTQRLRAATENDDDLVDRLLPFASFLRTDLRELPTVFLPGTVYVTESSANRDSGTAYTSRALADEVVQYALEPLVYRPGPAEGAEPADWKLRPADDLLTLRVCDPAVGSGAILVAACRYLADRLTEAWAAEGTHAGVEAEEVAVLARRAVVDRCLYGVDRNPMAVEMAKLSLWLVTMAKERPFTFLDHALKAGDSLLGITSLDQLRAFHLDPDQGRRIHAQHGMWGDAASLDRLVKRAVDKRRRLTSIEVITVRDAEAKAALDAEASEELEAMQVVADVLVGAALSCELQGAPRLDDRLRGIAEVVGKAFDDTEGLASQSHALDRLREHAQGWLDAGRPHSAPSRRPLHWPLAFPEVFDAGAGFDAMVGNPPFLGGKRISGRMGTDFREYLVDFVARGVKGNADLVTYFFLRGSEISKSFGFLATNTISQGDTREVGLDQLIDTGWTIQRGVKSTPWPGEQTLEVAKVWATSRPWRGLPILGEAVVSGITASLDPVGRVTGNPSRLAANGGKSYQGSNVLGLGFTMPPEKAEELIRSDPRNAEVLLPYLSGEDLNSSPTQAASRWIINFFDWSEKKAQEYPDCFAIIADKVRPERQRRKADGSFVLRRPLPERYWHYAEKQPALYSAIANMDRVLTIAQVSKTVQPVFVPSKQVLSHKIIVFTYDDDFHFGLLSSTIHRVWVTKYSATMRSDLSYSPSDCFVTFPDPGTDSDVTIVGRILNETRSALMVANNEGLTKTYNRFHDPADRSDGQVELRRLHIELDYAVAAAYGWGDLALVHGFHPTPQGVRFTIEPAAQTEVLERLLELNHRRYAEEVAAGFHTKKKKVPAKRLSASLFDPH